MIDVFIVPAVALWVACGVWAWVLDMRALGGPEDGMDYMLLIAQMAAGPLILAIVLSTEGATNRRKKP